MSSDLSLQYIKGIGPKRAEAFIKDGLLTAKDLLFYIPRTYVSHQIVPTLAALDIKLRREYSAFDDDFDLKKNYRYEITVLGRVINHKEVSFSYNRKLLVMELADGSGGRVFLKFWSYVDFYKKQYPLGSFLSISGSPELDNFGKVNFNHPELEKLDDEDEKSFISGSILPIYPIKDNMRKAGVNTRILRKIILNLFEKELSSVNETLTRDIIKENDLMDLKDAIRNIHFPDTLEASEKAANRLKFNEIFYFELMLAIRHLGYSVKSDGLKINPHSPLARTLYTRLPFELTQDQKKVIKEIMSDMESGKPMNRLLQGDVGSGKTIVSLLTMLAVIDNRYQVAIMAPTEILAEQHYLSINKFTENLNIKVIQLVGGQHKKYRREILESIENGEANIIVGTHAMFEESVIYHKLGFIVIDEQHRFGVNQRSELIERAKSSLPENTIPHILVMSATPIPRTLSMTLYGDLDVSVIREMPKNRLPVKTRIAFDNQIDLVFDFVRKQLDKGNQAYIVYPLVEKSEKMEYKSAVEHYEKLKETEFKSYPCGLLHGQLFGYEKDEVMRDFLDKKYKVLIATTVIEVGIDIPNASIMVIEDAERFGLSQLHQLRGRVGRGTEQSFCILVTKDKFNYEIKRKDSREGDQKSAIVRLKTMEKTCDGFEISEMDMKLRGPGDIMGTKQSGLPEFRFLDLTSDHEIISKARNAAFKLIEMDPELKNGDNKTIRLNYQSHFTKQNYYDIA